MNYYKRHIGDYLKDTAHLSLLEHGIYTRLLDVYYSREAPIPEDQVHRLIGCRSKDEREATDSVLREYFVLSDGAWSQKRCDEEITAQREKAESNRANGKRGGRPRQEPKPNPKETQSVSSDNPSGTHAEPKRNLSHKPLATSQKEQEQTAPAAPADFRADLFARWKALPNSGGGAFLSKLLRDHKPEQRVLEAVEHTLGDTRADPKAFVLGVLNRQARAESELEDILRGAL